MHATRVYGVSLGRGPQLVEVINEDYADFVSLSTQLVNVDGAVARMQQPLTDLLVRPPPPPGPLLASRRRGRVLRPRGRTSDGRVL